LAPVISTTFPLKLNTIDSLACCLTSDMDFAVWQTNKPAHGQPLRRSVPITLLLPMPIACVVKKAAHQSYTRRDSLEFAT
ncbi:MAG: hypothetical protein VYA08_01165, partial [Pseudomonadota bacterium]|nr:hypothetical protein [Pseudomonadota bacterium]